MSQRLPPFTADHLLQSLSALPAASGWLVGFSGGADSTALLHALVALKEQLQTPFRAVYVDHGLHADSRQWQQHCSGFCAQWSIPFQSISIQINGTGAGLEAEAREKRYAAISSLLQDDEAVLTAHHADDQAETLLLNLMRGSGVDGLSGMPQFRMLGQHQLFRPMLSFHRQALIDYLNLNGVQWLEDPSNQTLDQDRNFIRNSALPHLESRFSGIVKRLLLTQQAMTESRALLEPLASRYLEAEMPNPLVLRTTAAMLSEAAMFKLIVRKWLKQAGVAGLTSRQLDELFIQLQNASPEHQICVQSADSRVRYFQDYLWLQPGPDIAACADLQWPRGTCELNLGVDLGSLKFSADTQAADTHFELPTDITVSSRSSKPGLRLSRGSHHQSLKNLFQSASIPFWLRDCIPLTLIGDELAAVGDWAISQTFASWQSQNHVKFNWQPNAEILQYLTAQQHNRQQHR